MKTLLFLFLLDYSGSMYQVFDKQVKHETLYHNMNALTLASNPNADSGAFIFGTQANKGCNDIKYIENKNSLFSKDLASIRPDAYGQTPLAKGLKTSIDFMLKNDVSNLVTITDGADSCKMDPCKELEKSNELLKKRNKKINLILIGYDLNKDKSKLQCFKELKLSQIKIDFLSIENAFELQNRLKEIAQTANNTLNAQSSNTNSGDSSSAANGNNDPNSQGAGTGSGINPNSQSGKNGKPGDPNDPNQSNQKAGSGSDSTNNAKNGTGKGSSSESSSDTSLVSTIEVLGAPANIQFTAKGSENKIWAGAYQIPINPDVYQIQSSSGETILVNVKIEPGQNIKLRWSDFFNSKTADVEIQAGELSFEWDATAETKAFHQTVNKFITFGNIQDKIENRKILFGEWDIGVNSPPWLKEALPKKKILLKSGQKITLTGIYNDLLTWQDCPDSSKSWVLEINIKGRQERHFVQAGVKKVPVLKESKIRWLTGDEAEFIKKETTTEDE